MATGPNVGFATLQIIPSMRGMQAVLRREVGSAAFAAEGARAASSFESGFGGGLSKVAGALATVGKVGAIGLGITGAVALKTAISFESAFAGVTKTVDGTAKQLAVLRDGIIDMANKVPASREAIAGVAEAAGALGIKTEAILGFTKVMIDLGETTNLTADQAANALARIANITQLPQDQFDRLGATLVALGNAGASTEAEIVEMAQRIAGAGHQVGLSQAEILSFASALSSVGIDAEAGGSSISRVFINIANEVASGGDKLAGFAKVAGLSAGAFAKAFKEDAAGATVSFIEGLKRISDDGGNVFAVLEDLGLSEIRVRDALLRAAGAGGLFREQLELGSAAWEENNALTEEANKRYETTAARLGILWNRVTSLALRIGDALLPAFNGLLDLIDKLGPVVATGFGAMIDAFKNGDVTSDGWVGVMERIGVAARVVVDWFKENWPQIRKTALEVFSAVRDAIVFFVTEIAPRVIDRVRTIVEWITTNFPKIRDTVEDVFSKFWKAGEAVVSFFEKNWPKVQAVVGSVVSFIVEDLWPKLSAAWETAKVEVAKLVAFFSERWDAIKEALANLSKVFIAWVAVTFGPLILFLQGAWENIKGIFKEAFDALLDFVENGMQAIRGIIDIVLGLLTLDFSRVWEGIKTLFGSIWDNLFSIAEHGIATVREVVEGVLGGLAHVWEVVWGGIKSFLSEKILGPIGEAVTNFFDGPVGGPKAIFAGGVAGVQAIWFGLMAAVSWVRDNVIDPIRRSFESLWSTLGTGFQTAVDTVTRIWKGILTALAIPINWVGEHIFPIIKSLWNAIPGVPDIAFNFVPITFAKGGWVPGSGNADTVPAMLTPGEYVIPKRYVETLSRTGVMPLIEQQKPPGWWEFASGGYVRPDQTALFWADQFSGRPWVANTQGPNGFDCSGFMSAIQNFIMGRNPYAGYGSGTRWSTPMMPRGGGFGFAPGLDPQYPHGFSVAIKRNAAQGGPDRVGHVVGTLAGVGVESSFTPGVRVPSPNNAANYGPGREKFHLPGYGMWSMSGGQLSQEEWEAILADARGRIGNAGDFLSAVVAIPAEVLTKAKEFIDLIKDGLGAMGSGEWADMLRDGVKEMAHQFYDEVKSKATGLGWDVIKSLPGIGIAATAASEGLPDFAVGGRVPGRIGAARIVRAHGGEEVIDRSLANRLDAVLPTAGGRTARDVIGRPVGGPIIVRLEDRELFRLTEAQVPARRRLQRLGS